MFAKHQYENYKTQTISTNIKKYYIFTDAEVPLYPTLAKKIVKRDQTMSYTGTGAELVNFVRSLSPFVMVYLTEEYVALMQQDHEDLLNMYLVPTS